MLLSVGFSPAAALVAAPKASYPENNQMLSVTVAIVEDLLPAPVRLLTGLIISPIASTKTGNTVFIRVVLKSHLSQPGAIASTA